MRIPLLALFGLAAIGGVLGQTVPVVSISGEPFSADMVVVREPSPNMRNELLTQTTRAYRDSRGRTRVDVSVPTSPAYTPYVTIYDPATGVHYSLDTNKKIARRFADPGFKPGLPPLPGDSSSATLIHNVCKFSPCPTSTSESLGNEFINDLAAEGRRITSVYRTSASSEEQSRSVVESWYSQELKLTLLMTESSSAGKNTTHVENLNRAEPDPLLFEVPSDYTIVEVR
jgi:hypothetical protein